MGASAWNLAGFGVAQAIRFGSNLLMTRLLLPETFGIMAIATTVMVGLALFSDVGLGPNVIRSKRGNDPLFLNTAWTFQIFRGVALWLFAVSAAFLLYLADRRGLVPETSAYADTRVPYVIAALSFNFVIFGFQSTKTIEAQRTLSFARVTKISLIAQVVGLICMLAWVSIDRAIWALVAGSICSALVATLLSHIWLPGIANRLQWERSAYWEIIHFGKWIVISSILGFLMLNGDRLLLGGLVSATVLGVYSIASAIVDILTQVLIKIISDVSFPALSEVARDRPARLRGSYYGFHRVIAFSAYFCSGSLMGSGHTLINLLYDKRYEDAGWMVQILAVSLLTIPFRLATQSLLVVGSAKIYSYINALWAATLYIGMPVGFHFFGLSGAVWGYVGAYFSLVPIAIAYMIKFGLFDVRQEILALPAIFAGVLFAEGFNLTIPLLLNVAGHIAIHN
jgi:O-antigen/teichoic acid export membrane protein